MRIILLRLSALGDILRVLPAWANLRKAFPEARLQAVVEDRHAFLLEPLPWLEPVLVRRRALARPWSALGECRRLARELPSAAELAETRREVPAHDPGWALDKGLLPALEGWDAQAFHAYLAQARAGHPDGALRRSLLFEYFTDMIDTSTESEWLPPYGMLIKDFPGSLEARKAEARLASEATTAVGALAPPFDLPSLEDPATRFTPATFRGSYVLIDFWASWCPDCVREMAGLHQAWARYKDKGLDILSLSLDRKAEHINRYRAQPATPMPWKHAFLEGAWKNPVCEAWGVMSIPKPVLVGPDGSIVASGADLRGENLEKTLGKFLER